MSPTMIRRLKPSLNERDHVLGNRHAPLVLCEYGDYECPHCGAGLLVVRSSEGNEFADPPQTLDPEGILTTPRTMSPFLFGAGLVVVALVFVGLFFLLR